MANINNENEEGIKYFEQLELIYDIFNKNYKDNYNLSKKNFNLFINQSPNTAYNNLFVLIFLHIKKIYI